MLLGATKIGDGESTRAGAGRNTYISFCFFTFCSYAHEEGMKREKQTASWKAFTYLIFPLRRFNRRWTLLLEVLFAVENLLVSVRRRWSVRPTFCSDSRISPFRPSLLSPPLLPCLFVSFYFFHIFLPFFPGSSASNDRHESSTTQTSLLCTWVIKFYGNRGGQAALPFEINISSVSERMSFAQRANVAELSCR